MKIGNVKEEPSMHTDKELPLRQKGNQESGVSWEPNGENIPKRDKLTFQMLMILKKKKKRTEN